MTGIRLPGGLRGEGLLLIVLMIALGPLASGCIGLFRPATAQSPEQSDSVNIPLDYGDPVPPEVSGGVWRVPTLETMAAGIGAKGLGNGKAAYIGAFADSTVDRVPFYATFDSDLDDLFPGEFPRWNLDLEKNFYSDFVALRREGYLMRWSEAAEPGDEFSSVHGDIYRTYEVFTVSEDGTSDSDRIAVGIAHLVLEKKERGWLIVLWEDIVDPAIGPAELSIGAHRLGTQ